MDDDSKFIEVLPPSEKSKVARPKTTTTPASKPKVSAATDKPQADQPQADVPADPEEELTEDMEDNLGELEDVTIDEPVIEPITAESLKRTYRDAFSQL